MHRRGGEENAEPELIEVRFADLRSHYIRIARDGMRAPLDAELAEDHLQSYFVAADGGEEVADYKWYKGRTGDSANLQSILGLTILDAERLRKTQRRGKHAKSTLQSFSPPAVVRRARSEDEDRFRGGVQGAILSPWNPREERYRLPPAAMPTLRPAAGLQKPNKTAVIDTPGNPPETAL